MKQVHIAALVIGLTGGAFALSCRIQARTSPLPPSHTPSAGAALLGQSRLGLSGYFYAMADLYFHRGVPHQHEEAIHSTWFQKRRTELKPHAHLHATGHAAQEVLPWLRLATALNPHNVDFLLLAAFWLHHKAGSIDLAHRLLKDAQADNPFEYEIQLERGRLYLYENNIPAARRCCDAALAFWPSRLAPAETEARRDRARILLYRSLIHELDGEREKAVAGLREILRLFPERTHLRDRIRTLAQGREPVLLENAVWNNLLQSEGEHSMLCSEGHADHHEHEKKRVHGPDCE